MISAWSLSVNKQDAEQRERLMLLELLLSRASWPEGELVSASHLTDKAFQRVMLDLLNGGHVRRVHVTGRTNDVMYRAVTAGAAQFTPARALASLTPEVQGVFRSLVKPNTALDLARRLSLPVLVVKDALAQLHDQGLVTCNYVGMLDIYRRVAPPAAAPA